jgi:hypothetical protein
LLTPLITRLKYTIQTRSEEEYCLIEGVEH